MCLYEGYTTMCVDILVTSPDMEHGFSVRSEGLSYLSRRFKKETGVSLGEYIARVRIDTAKGLLAAGATVTDTARRITGQSPSRFGKG